MTQADEIRLAGGPLSPQRQLEIGSALAK
eukprot:SAG31_NODE_17179_length_680_cov_1.072289_2_plen_28_part_01